MAISQLRAFGAFSGRRFGSFSGKRVSRPVGELTQARAFGAFAGLRYGSFAGKTEGIPPIVVVVDQGSGGGSVLVPRLRPWHRPEKIEEDEALLLAVLR